MNALRTPRNTCLGLALLLGLSCAHAQAKKQPEQPLSAEDKAAIGVFMRYMGGGTLMDMCAKQFPEHADRFAKAKKGFGDRHAEDLKTAFMVMGKTAPKSPQTDALMNAEVERLSALAGIEPKSNTVHLEGCQKVVADLEG